MQATTSGEIRKQFYDDSFIKNFLISEKKTLESFIKKPNTVYSQKILISDPSLNYLNTTKNDQLDDCLRNMIIKEYHVCEKLYPYLGDYFLFKFFNFKMKKSQKKIFSKNEESSFISTINNKSIKAVSKWIFENSNINKSVFVKDYSGKEIAIETTSEFTFNINYDYDYFQKLNNVEIKNYRLIVIDGFVESVGEIHHLLVKANKTMEPYVIFCYGMSEEVKFNIMKNNHTGRLKVYPVCLDANDEYSLNVLNDLSVIQNTDVISSNLGQTISQATRNDLDLGQKIIFLKNKVLIEPCIDKRTIESHRRFLKKRIEDAKAKGDVNTKPIENRLKMFSGEKINLYIPKQLFKNKKTQRDLDYFLRFMNHLNKIMITLSFTNQKVYIPYDYINIANAKVKSLQEKMNDVKVIIIDRSQ